MFLSIPATVHASAETSFGKRKLIKNYLKNTISQDRVVDLARLSIECKLAQRSILMMLSKFAEEIESSQSVLR